MSASSLLGLVMIRAGVWANPLLSLCLAQIIPQYHRGHSPAPQKANKKSETKVRVTVRWREKRGGTQPEPVSASVFSGLGKGLCSGHTTSLKGSPAHCSISASRPTVLCRARYTEAKL